MKKKLSIITINYNNLPGLQKTIDSVISQSFKDFEWILIDGASTDGSKDLIERYSSSFSYWVSEPDKGIYNAMNKGIRKASGEYLLFLNSGDYLQSPSTLENVFSFGFHEDVVYGYLLVDHGDRIIEDKHDGEVTLGTFIFDTIHHSGCSFIRKELFGKYGEYDEALRIVSDWKFFLCSVGLNGASVKFIDVPVSVFDAHGIGSVNKELCASERKKVLEEVVPPRILRDYFKMESERLSYETEIKRLRSTYSFRIGSAVLWPFKCISRLVKK
jgi:glycosyltransferase involved in cell wall biosynthesis